MNWFIVPMPLSQAVRHVCPGTHVQLRGDPFQRHRRLRAQAPRHVDFAAVAFGSRWQICPRPTQLVQFFLHDSARLALRCLTARLAWVTFAGAGLRVCQQLLAELFAPQTPTAPDGLEPRPVRLRAARCEAVRQLFPPRLAVAALPQRLRPPAVCSGPFCHQPHGSSA